MTLFVGAIFAALSGLGIAWLLGANQETLLSSAAKSITTPIAMEVTAKIGGTPALSAGIVITTGIVGAIIASGIFRLFKIEDERIQGFTLGLVAHGVGTAKAFEISPLAGAFASLGLGLTGVVTAIGVPLAFQYITL